MEYQDMLLDIKSKIENIKREGLKPECVVLDKTTYYEIIKKNETDQMSPVWRSFTLPSAPYIDMIYGLPISTINVDYEDEKEKKPYIKVYAKGKR